MASNKAKAAAVIGGGAALALLLTRKPAKADEAPKGKVIALQPRATLVALATKFARLFKVPTSLVLAIIRAQSANRADAYRDNKRGGAWGYGQMTLDTAADLTKRYPDVAKKYWPRWNGTGKGLLDPAVNVAMTAFYLSLSWRKYQRSKDAWNATALAYVLGPGAADALMKGGNLITPLPAGAAATKARIIKAAQSDPVVKRALANEMTNTSGVGDSDPLVWTPSAISAEFDRIRIVLDTVNNEVSAAEKAKKVTGQEWKTWADFYGKAHKFVTTASNWWGSNVSQARKLEQDAAKWRTLVIERGGKLLGPSALVRQPDKGFFDKVNESPGYVKAGLAIGALAAGAALVSALKK